MARKKDLFESAVETPARALEDAIEGARNVAHFITTKKPVKEARGFWRALGPGLTTGASDDDPAGIATYSQAGAQYGFQFLWLAPLTFPLMAAVQEMCARIGLATGRGLAENIRNHFPRWVLYLCTVLLFGANTFNIGADLGAMAQAAQLLFPGGSFAFFLFVFAGMSLMLQIFSTYERYAHYLKYLALILLAYVVAAFFVSDLDWGAVVRATVVPSFGFSRDQILIICAVLGTTISPYLFFWQTSQEVEEEILDGKKTLRERQGTNRREISRMRLDVWFGMFLSNLVMFFIIVVCGATLYAAGITNIATAADAAEALRPLAGNAAYLLFAVGIIGTGLLAIPVLAGSAAYAVAESFHWKNGLYRKLKHAYAFYGVLIIAMAIGFGLNFIGLDPIKALIYSAIANGIIAPIILSLIVMIASSRSIMGKWANGRLTTSTGWIAVMIMMTAGLLTLVAIVSPLF